MQWCWLIPSICRWLLCLQASLWQCILHMPLTSLQHFQSTNPQEYLDVKMYCSNYNISYSSREQLRVNWEEENRENLTIITLKSGQDVAFHTGACCWGYRAVMHSLCWCFHHDTRLGLRDESELIINSSSWLSLNRTQFALCLFIEKLWNVNHLALSYNFNNTCDNTHILT